MKGRYKVVPFLLALAALTASFETGQSFGSERSSPPPLPEGCNGGDWSPWGACSGNGLGGGCWHTRTRTVTGSGPCPHLSGQDTQRFGRIDCAFNGAGIEGTPARIADHQEEEYDRVMGVNAKGVWLCLKYEIAQMLQQEPVVSDPARWADKPDVCRFRGQRGSIVNDSSRSGLGPMPYSSAYCASKWAILGITETAAAEYAKDGIRVNAVCPALTATSMLSRLKEKLPADFMEKLDAMSPVGRVAAPQEVAEAVCWLCSDACPFTTGEHLKIAGGI
uniref:Uncharacterized protein n=1 Tax=Branchiostoma floridae TaxID=7739 RepID=C3YXA5_BRAFL|eukprot:XP_002599111.1 hypothetical protein BRAFLDRAFT_81775 [Branchiostoma floridae]